MIGLLRAAAPLAGRSVRMVHTENKLGELGHALPEMPKALGVYVPAVRNGNLVRTGPTGKCVY